ncbi:MAG: DNA translocase FtsK 4TM domain-containing protein [Armatimonadetes bacterium]|nr:DNA translocase FtsK 4TM domain-containing protein [Armatimonadota bacterium]
MAKARASSRPRKASPAAAQKTKRTGPLFQIQNLRLFCELLGIACFALGTVLLVGLSVGDRGGIVIDRANTALRSLMGVGAYAVPLLLMMVGGMALMGIERTFSRNALAGVGILFLSALAWRHLSVSVLEKNFDTAARMAGGGYVGGAFAWALRSSVGELSAYIVLSALILASVLLITNASFMAIMGYLKQGAAGGVKLTRQGAEQIRKTRGVSEKPARPVRAKKRVLALPDGGELEVPLPGDDDIPAPKEPDPEPHPVREKPQPVIQSAKPKKAAREEVLQPPLIIPAENGEEEGETPFDLPPIDLLQEPPASEQVKTPKDELQEKIRIIEQTLEDFKIDGKVVEIGHGPTVSRYEIQLAPGILVSKIVRLADNLAMSLEAIDVRVVAPIPGKSAIGLEVPNSHSALVTLRDVLETQEFWSAPSKLTFALGLDVGGEPKYADLARMPHLLIGGATNAGKSVCLNTLLTSLLYRATPKELRLILIDPKRVELSLFDGIPHLLWPVVKDIKQAAGIFRAALKEMENRYDLFSKTGSRNIVSYNQKVEDEEQKLPYIVIVVDELADLMMQAANEVETSICRLAQLARATGIHLVIATQRPSVDVITGTIKANISSRIAFAVSSQVDSRTILDMAGADRLVGRGDMLFKPIDAIKPTRIQGAYVGEQEIENVVEFLKQQGRPDYTMEPVDSLSGGDGEEADSDDAAYDELFEPAVRWSVSNGHISTSMLQRKFKIGYTRAARIVDAMEQKGIVGPLDGVKPREVLLSREDVDRLFLPKAYAGLADMAAEEDEEK